MKKKNRKRRYPFPEKDEKRNRELRDARAINAYGEKPLDARDIGSTQSQYNRKVENQAKKSFEDIDKLREQVEFIENLPNFKSRKTASIKALTTKLVNTPLQRWTPKQTEHFKGLGSKLKQEILRRKEKKGN